MNMLWLYTIAVAHLVSVDFVGALSTQALPTRRARQMLGRRSTFMQRIDGRIVRVVGVPEEKGRY